MDDDSCGKFIGSLTKYLQSLCHSYVDFDNGVELVGHIYLNVDTGKKIDYVLNESVCKNGANVVKFTSNSYHAQPVDKKDKKETTPKKDSAGGGKSGRRDDDDVIIVGSEGSRRAGGNRTPGSSPMRSHASPGGMGRGGMGMSRMSPGGMFRSPRGMSPRFGGPAPRPGGYTYQPRQRLTYPQSPRNLMAAGYSPRMRQPYQPRGGHPMGGMRGPPAANHGAGPNPSGAVDTDVAFMREEYVIQPGSSTSTSNQAGYTTQGSYQQGQHQQQPLLQTQQQTGQVSSTAGQPYAPTNMAVATTGMTVPMTVPMTTPGEASHDGVNVASTTDPSQSVASGMPLPVTTHTIFDSGPVMAPSMMDLPTAQPEGGSTDAAADSLAAAMATAEVPTTSTGMTLEQNLLINKVWSDSDADPSSSSFTAATATTTGQTGADLSTSTITANASFPTGSGVVEGGSGFDIFHQASAQSSSNSSNPDADGGFSALVSELRAFNQQAAGGGAPTPTTTPTPPSQPSPNTTTASPAAETGAAYKPSYGLSRTGEKVLIKRDPGAMKRDPDHTISANIASSVLQESSEAAAANSSAGNDGQGGGSGGGSADHFQGTKGPTTDGGGGGVQGGGGGWVDRNRDGGGDGVGSGSNSKPGDLVGPESVVIETKPFLHQTPDYESETPTIPTSSTTLPQQHPHSSSTPSSSHTAQPGPSSSSSSSSMIHPVSVKKERKEAGEEGEEEEEEEEEEEAGRDQHQGETIKHAQAEWSSSKSKESDWVTDMSALNNSDDSMQSDSDTAQDDDDPNYMPGRPLGAQEKAARKRAPRRPTNQKAPKSPTPIAPAETSQQQTHTPQKTAPAPLPPPSPIPEDNVVNILDSDEEEEESQGGGGSGGGGGYTLPPNVFIKKEMPEEMTVKQEPRDDDFEENTLQLPVIESPRKRHAGDPALAAAGMKRRPWTEREKEAVAMYFRTYLEGDSLPGKVEIEAVMAAESSLQGRTWNNIKDYLRNAQQASSKRPLPKSSGKGSKSKRRKLDSDGAEDDRSGDTDEDADPPLPEVPPSLDSDQHMGPDYDEVAYKPGTFILVNVTKDSDRSGRMRPAHTPAEVIVPPEGQPEGLWVHLLVPAGPGGLWRLPNVEQLVGIRVDPGDVVKTLDKSHVNIVGQKVLYKFDDISSPRNKKASPASKRGRSK